MDKDFSLAPIAFFAYKRPFHTRKTLESLIRNDLAAKSKELIKHNPIGFFGCHSAWRIDRLIPIIEDLNVDDAHLYFNITTVGENFGNHKDNEDVYFWQCQGISKWIIEDKEYILEPGDLIIVPAGVYHNVKALTPRAGVSMSKGEKVIK